MEFESLFRDNAEEWNGLTVYPVRMRDYPAFLTARGCITAAQQSWPYPWSTVKYLDGLVGMGMLPQLAVMLQTVLRLEEDPLSVFPKMKGDKLDAFVRGEHPELAVGVILVNAKLEKRQQDTIIYYMLEQYEIADAQPKAA